MKRLVVLIIKYLKSELASNKLDPDTTEGVEVAVQCLESAYGVTAEDIDGCNLALEVLCASACSPTEESGVVTPEQKEEAESLKLLGNKFMSEAKYKEAIGLYSRAILLDSKNTVYFCNRAAAFIQTKNYLAAINDCHEAIRLDPNYSKAYSRLGYAFGAIGNKIKARDCYAKAMDLEPENESYQNCYKKLLDPIPCSSRQVPDLLGLLPGIDFSAIMKNPSFQQMATQMMEDPGMQHVGQQLAERLQSRMEMQQQYEGSSTEQETSEASGSEGPMEQQDRESQETFSNLATGQESASSTEEQAEEDNAYGPIPTPAPDSAAVPARARTSSQTERGGYGDGRSAVFDNDEKAHAGMDGDRKEKRH